MAFGRIPENILEDILGRVDIVEVVSGYIPLKKAGRNFRANCPFHHEKTPSFMVSPDRQIYHCFGCGVGGNAFNFLMQYDRLEFPEAVESLAKKAGVALPEARNEDPKSASLGTQLYKVNELAVLFFQQSLHSKEGTAAKDYLSRRGLGADTLRQFKLGFAPERWDGLINFLRAKDISLGLMEKAGLILAKEKGGYYDRFRGRIIFPIFDIKSRVLGFGGRILAPEKSEAGLAKYVNSPETPIYTKGRNLYGLNFAKDAIRGLDFTAIVEGYLDFILPFAHDFQNILASQGTALTVEQVHLIKRYTQNVVMVYDADNAGEMATLRTLDIFIEEGLNVRVFSLPKGLDPDLFVRHHGADAFREGISKADNLFDYKLRILRSRYSASEIEGKAKICAEMLPTINKLENAVLKSEYLKKLSSELKVDEAALTEEVKKIRQPKVSAAREEALPCSKSPLKISPAERMLLKLMFEEKELIERIKNDLLPSDFSDERVARIVELMFDLFRQGKSIEPKGMFQRLGDERFTELICESVFMPEASGQHREKVVDDCIHRLKSERIRSKRQELQEKIKAAQDCKDEDQLGKLMRDFHSLIKKR